MVLLVRPVADFDEIASDLAIWHAYDPAVKAELYSTHVATAEGSYLIDPIPLQSEVLNELTGSGPIAGVIVTNSNHHRNSEKIADEYRVPLFAHDEAFAQDQPRQLRKVVDGEEICGALHVIAIEGAAPGEIVLHYVPDGGTLIVGDALINFELYGFTMLPAKYCSNQKQMRRSLRKLLDYQVERILFGHGTPILSGADKRLRALLDSDL
jgi:glyoxylase-like metal-dependent hydrolase (beta-lactamase superfamily II)